MVITDHVSTESRYGTNSFLRLTVGCVECSAKTDITLPSMCSEVLMLTPSYIVVTCLQLLINLIHRNRNSKWSKNFEERLHHGGGQVFYGGTI